MASVLNEQAGYDPQPMIDRRAIPTYLLLFVVAVGAALLIVSMGFTVTRSALAPLWPIAVLVFGAWMLRRIGHGRVATGIEATALLYFQGLAALFLLVPLTALRFPFVDEQLAYADALIGFSWPAYAYASVRFATPMNVSYLSFFIQPLILIPTLVIWSREERLWRFVFAYAFALVIACMIYAVAPAEGAAIHFGIQSSDLPEISKNPWIFPRVIHRIRVGATVIDRSLAGGVISFPSFHSAAAVLFAWAAWPFKFWRWPMFVLNVAVILSAISLGSHYLVDIIAGVALAWLALRVSSVIWRHP